MRMEHHTCICNCIYTCLSLSLSLPVVKGYNRGKLYTCRICDTEREREREREREGKLQEEVIMRQLGEREREEIHVG